MDLLQQNRVGEVTETLVRALGSIPKGQVILTKMIRLCAITFILAVVQESL